MNSSARVLTTLLILLVLDGTAHAQYMGNSTATPTLPAPLPPGSSSVYGKTYNGPADPLLPPPPGSSSVYGKTYNGAADPLLPPPPNSGANPYGRYGNLYSPDSTNGARNSLNPASPYNENSPYNPNRPYNPYGAR